MSLKFEDIVEDLKKAKYSISALRKERDHLKDTILSLEESQRESLSRQKSLIEENKLLRSKLSTSIPSSLKEEVCIKISQLFHKFTSYEHSKISYDSFLTSSNLVNLIQKNQFLLASSHLCDILLKICPYDSAQKTMHRHERTMSKSYKTQDFYTQRSLEKSYADSIVRSEPSLPLDSDYSKLFNESTALIKLLEKQNYRIGEISKNFTSLVGNKTHKISKSMANLRVPEFSKSSDVFDDCS